MEHLYNLKLWYLEPHLKKEKETGEVSFNIFYLIQGIRIFIIISICKQHKNINEMFSNLFSFFG